MLRALLASFTLFLSLLLAACGDSDGGPAASPASTASGTGNVVKGLVRNGIVSAWRRQDTGWVKVASVRTNDAGDFALVVPDPVPGEILRLELGVAGDAQMLCDVAQCGSAMRGAWVPLSDGMGLASWAAVGSDGRLTVMPLTPVSTLLVRHAEEVGAGRLNASALEVARLRVAALFGLSPEALMVRPGNILNPLWREAASPEALKLSLLSAAFAEVAQQRGMGAGEVLAAFVARFNDLGGHLMQAGEDQALQEIYKGIYLMLNAADAPAMPEWVQDWVFNVGSTLVEGERTRRYCAPDCGDFDSAAFLAALGSGSGTLGGDLARLMAEKGVTRLEDLVAGELAHYGWLLGSDSLQLAKSAFELAGLSALGALGFPFVPASGLTLERSGNTLYFDGSLNGFAVDLDVTVPPLLEMIRAYTAGSSMVFVVKASGHLENARMRARIDGSLTIDASATNFLPLKQALDAYVAAMLSGDAGLMATAQSNLLAAVADLLRTGAATFTLDGDASLTQLELQGETLAETRQLGVSGRGWMTVDMDGTTGGLIAAQGAVEHGMLQLPNGDHFRVDPEQGHFLRFALGRHGTAEVNFAAHVLGHGAAVSGNGTLAELGPLLDNLRDAVAAQLQSLTLDIEGTLAQLLADIQQLTLTVAGQAVIPDYGHSYSLTIAAGVLTISQPGGSGEALRLMLGRQGLLAIAGGKWWLVGVDLASAGGPFLTLADSSGGEWSWPLLSLLPAS